MHLPLHDLNPQEKDQSNLLFSAGKFTFLTEIKQKGFGFWLLNHSDGYFLNSVIVPHDLLRVNVQHNFDNRTRTTQEIIVSPDQASKTIMFFKGLYDTLEDVFLKLIPSLCENLGTRCHCGDIVNDLAKWDFTRFGEGKEKIRLRLIGEIYSCVRLAILKQGARNVFLPEAQKLFSNVQNDIYYYCQWTYGVIPFFYICNIYKKILCHNPGNVTVISDLWVFLNTFTVDQCPSHKELDSIFATDVDLWKVDFPECRPWKDTWLPDARQDFWLAELTKTGFTNQNEKLWAGETLYLYTIRDPKNGPEEFKVRLVPDPASINDSHARNMERLKNSRAWERHSVLFYRGFFRKKSGKVPYPLNQTLVIRNDGLVCITNQNTLLQIVGILKSKRMYHPKKETPKTLFLTSSLNKQIG